MDPQAYETLTSMMRNFEILPHRATMDPQIYQKLTTMMRNLERLSHNPDFRPSSAYDDPSTLTFQHPDDVIVVTSRSLRSFPPLRGERFRFVKLNDALSCVVTQAKEAPGTNGYTIVVDAGIYVDDLFALHRLYDLPKIVEGFTVEIVGIKTVVLVCKTLVFLKKITLVLKNIDITSSSDRNKTDRPVVRVGKGGHVRMVDVRTHASDCARTIILVVEGAGSKISLNECSFFMPEDTYLFYAAEGGTFAATRCRVGSRGRMCRVGHARRASVSIVETLFANSENLAMYDSRCDITACQFIGDGSPDSKAFYVDSKSHLVIGKSTIDNFDIGLYARRGSNVRLRASRVANCKVAIVTQFSNQITATENEFLFEHSRFHPNLLIARGNFRGRVEFKRNRVIGGAPLFDSDNKSVAIDHDFKEYAALEKKFDLVRLTVGFETTSSKIRSRHTKRKKEEMKNGALKIFDAPYKTCAFCEAAEQLAEVSSESSEAKGDDSKRKPDVDEGGKKKDGKKDGKKDRRKDLRAKMFPKFKYCPRCHVCCYCTAECQRDDWEYHQIICAKLCEESKRKYD